MPQIMLYDASTGELAPIVHGDAIRVEIHTANLASQGLVDVASTRPFVLFSLLQRLLQNEGLPTKFLFGSPGAGEVLRELDLEAELEADDDAYEHDEDFEHDARLDADADFDLAREIERRRIARAEAAGEDDNSTADHEGRCVDIRFGAAREGEQEWAGGESAGRMTLSEAMRRFGHHALVFYLMGTHYSQPLGDPVLGMTNARQHVQRLRETLAKLSPGQPSPPDMRHHVETFRDALATDLDTPSAFVALFEWVLDAEQRDYDLGDAHLRHMLELLELVDL
ncbi:MAG: hypothetical protein ACTHM1_00410 [Solirubrobacteraceae bacterium]